MTRLLGCSLGMLAAGALLSAEPVFDGERAYRLLEAQCEMGPRNPGSKGHLRFTHWADSVLHVSGWEVFFQPFTGVNNLQGRSEKLVNIVARLRGTSETPPLMLCAHYDTRPFADRDPNESKRELPILGANDGASGVAVLMEMARILAKVPQERTIIIALFDGEDMGRGGSADEFALGSKYWAGLQLPQPVSQAILLDMVGDADLSIYPEYFSRTNARGLHERLWELAKDLRLPAFAEGQGPAVEDDHIALQKAGIEAVDLIDFDYQYWHTMGDTPDRCSAESLEQVGRLLMAFIYSE